ncbi:hypothetical protein FHU10_1376 [Serratia fonticola]|uniref:Uncharacterized protein n=1 Tax=Serratia fonticola TaxID=47917 RepID=A0A542BJ48_SERFO|nr:hypothetical protein FHU09_1074 [Serratia fonticola]TVZ68914.1 hypothetical protein FHU10_1376 [Serratia fonticola]
MVKKTPGKDNNNDNELIVLYGISVQGAGLL